MRTSAVGSRRSGWRAALVALAVLGATMATTLVTTAPAHARCDGVNKPVTMILRDAAGNHIAREQPSSGTCNGNRTYTGLLVDPRDDSNCVQLHIAHAQGEDAFKVFFSCDVSVLFDVAERDGVLWFGLHALGLQVGRRNVGF
jgi:hypothetical protein